MTQEILQSIDRRTKAMAFLDNLGVKPLSSDELHNISVDYQNALLSGLQEIKGKSNLSMLPTLLQPVEFTNLTVGDEALVVEIGGTNVRAAVVTINKDHQPVIKSIADSPVYHEGKINRTVFKNADDFYNEVFEKIQPVLSGHKPKALGVIYSFAGEAVKTKQGIDMKAAEEMTKGFEVPGIDSELVGQAFLKRLKERDEISDNCPVLVINDGVAVLEAMGAEVKMGGVVSTGFNLVITINGSIYNIEPGEFSQVPSSPIAKLIDFFSGKMGQSLAEKQISGKYLEEMIGHTIHLLIDEELLDRRLTDDTYHADASTITDILEGRIAKIEEKVKIVSDSKKGLDSISKSILKELARRLRQRSAQLVGTMIGTTVTTFREEFIEEEVVIPVEGAFFWKIPGYANLVGKYASQIAKGKKFRFVEIPHAGILGAGAAALSMLRRE